MLRFNVVYNQRHRHIGFRFARCSLSSHCCSLIQPCVEHFLLSHQSDCLFRFMLVRWASSWQQTWLFLQRLLSIWLHSDQTIVYQVIEPKTRESHIQSYDLIDTIFSVMFGQCCGLVHAFRCSLFIETLSSFFSSKQRFLCIFTPLDNKMKRKFQTDA